MTEQQTAQQMADDNITLDYSKWAAARRMASNRRNPLSTDHALWEQERDRVLSRQKSDNEHAKQEHLASLDRQRKFQAQTADAEKETRLTGEKLRLKNQWLADHPGMTAADFETQAWGLLKANLFADAEKADYQAALQEAAASGRYSL